MPRYTAVSFLPLKDFTEDGISKQLQKKKIDVEDVINVTEFGLWYRKKTPTKQEICHQCKHYTIGAELCFQCKDNSLFEIKVIQECGSCRFFNVSNGQHPCKTCIHNQDIEFRGNKNHWAEKKVKP